jgi:chromodomain-helicase-DNA-binding protein 1
MSKVDGDDLVPEYLVKWQGLPYAESTWYFFLNRIYLIIFSAWFCMLASWYIVNCIPTLFWILCCREKDTDIEFAQDAIDEYKVMYSVSI